MDIGKYYFMLRPTSSWTLASITNVYFKLLLEEIMSIFYLIVFYIPFHMNNHLFKNIIISNYKIMEIMILGLRFYRMF